MSDLTGGAATESPAPPPAFSANALFTLVSWLIPALAALICLPITVNGLGPDVYGLLALVIAVTGYLGLMEMGLGQAVLRYLAYYRARNEGHTVLAIVRVALLWFIGAGAVGCVFMLVAAPWLTHSVLKMPPDLEGTATTVVRLSGFNFLLGMLVSLGAVIPQGFLRYDIAASIATFLGTANSVGMAIVVASGGGVVLVVLFLMASNIVACGLYGAFGWRLLSRLDRRAGPLWREVRRPVLTFAALTAATRAHTVVAAQTSRIVVGIAGGTTDAAYYQVPNMLSTRVNDLLSRVAQVLFPTGTDLLARGEHEALRTLYFRSSRIFFLVNGTVTMAVCVFAAPLLRYWVGPAFAEAGAVALVVFTATQGINAITMAPGFLNLSADRPGVNLTFSLANSIINLATVYSLTVRYGITGAALAGLLGAATVPFFMVFTHRRILHVPSLAWFRRCLAPTIAGSTVVGLAAGFFVLPLCHRLLVTLLLWAACVLAAMALSGVLGALSRDDLRTARRLAASVLGRGRRAAAATEDEDAEREMRAPEGPDESDRAGFDEDGD